MDEMEMNDLISRQWLIECADKVWVKFDTERDKNIYIHLVRDLAPSADVLSRKTAEWVYGEKDGADGWYCSGCGFHIPWYYDYYGLQNIDFIRDFHTCPHCDAKMVKYTGMKGEWNG